MIELKTTTVKNYPFLGLQIVSTMLSQMFLMIFFGFLKKTIACHFSLMNGIYSLGCAFYRPLTVHRPQPVKEQSLLIVMQLMFQLQLLKVL